MDTPHEIEGRKLLIDASIGISIAPDDSIDRDQLLKNADLALYAAKAGGRGTYCFFQWEMDQRMKARQQLESDLSDALTRGEFELCYQPIVNLLTNRVSGCEALLRWRHPERGIIEPAEFLPVAEESGLIVPLGDWVMKQACRDAAEWPSDKKVAVNVSAVQLSGTKLVPAVAGALA
jgi:predicted signal transduction protein with EAL and GGDEF domain